MSLELYIKEGFYNSTFFKYYSDNNDAILGFGLYRLDRDILRWLRDMEISAKFKINDLTDNDYYTAELGNLSCDIFSRSNYDLWLVFDTQEDYNLFKLTWR